MKTVYSMLFPVLTSTQDQGRVSEREVPTIWRFSFLFELDPRNNITLLSE